MTRRTWVDGRSRLDVERDPSGRIRIVTYAVDDDVVRDGYGATFSPDVSREIVEFITEAK